MSSDRVPISETRFRQNKPRVVYVCVSESETQRERVGVGSAFSFTSTSSMASSNNSKSQNNNKIKTEKERGIIDKDNNNNKKPNKVKEEQNQITKNKKLKLTNGNGNSKQHQRQQEGKIESKLKHEEEDEEEEIEEAKSHVFPMNRIRTMIKGEDPEARVSTEAILAINKAAEKFLEQFTQEAYTRAVQDRKKSLSYNHLAHVVSKQRRYDFLSDFVPEKVRAEDALREISSRGNGGG